MTKKLLSILLTLVMVLSIAPIAVFAEDDILSYLTYEIADGEVTITDCDTSISGNIVIPDTIEGYPVTTIGYEAFAYCVFEIITIPNSVVKIEDSAFIECKKLTSVIFSENSNLTHIGPWAFAGCSFESVELPDSVKIIDYTAFGYCYFMESITIPEGVERIEPSTFVGCMSLGKINFPDSIKYIDCAFDICPSLEEISIPKNMTAQSEYSFSTSGRLKHIYIYNTTIDLTDSNIGYQIGEFNANFDEFTKILNEIKSIYINGGDIDDELATYIDESYVFLDEPEKIEDFTIHGYKGSTAETYANEHGFNFVPICDHINTETINILEADCKNDGYTGDVYCNDCEEIISNGETIPSTGHNYIDNIIKEPTYSQYGAKNSVCENCGDTTAEESIPKLEIEYSEIIEDKDNDVSVIFPEGTFDGEVKIEVTPVAEDDAFKLISHKQGNYKVTIFDIIVTVDGQKVQPNGTVLVKIPLPKGYNQNKCVVYYVADDGTMEELKTYHYKDGYVYFETDHFSYYAIIDDSEETSGGAAWMDESLSVIDRFIAFINAIIAWFKSLFGMA